MCLSHEDGRNCDRETTPDCRALAFRASSGLRAGAQQLLGSLHHAFRRLTRATRHQRPALHTKITTAGVCDETASTVQKQLGGVPADEVEMEGSQVARPPGSRLNSQNAPRFGRKSGLQPPCGRTER